jgi:acyl carrier protein
LSVLPEYMVPAAYVRLESLPLTPNGKLDRKALPTPEITQKKSRIARTPPEEILCSLFAEILHLDQVSIDDNFFELGGNSILGMSLISRIRSTLGIQIPIATLFESPTVTLLLEQSDEVAIAFLTNPNLADSWL